MISTYIKFAWLCRGINIIFESDSYSSVFHSHLTAELPAAWSLNSSPAPLVQYTSSLNLPPLLHSLCTIFTGEYLPGHWILKTSFWMACTSRGSQWASGPAETVTSDIRSCLLGWTSGHGGQYQSCRTLAVVLSRVQFSPSIGPEWSSWVLLQISSYEDTHTVSIPFCSYTPLFNGSPNILQGWVVAFCHR